MVLRIYADREHFSEGHRRSLDDILKALWYPAATRAEGRAQYGVRAELFELAASPDEADLHLLPMRWQYYVDQGRVDLVYRTVEVARRARRPLAVFSMSDFEANFPIPGEDIHVFQASGYRSSRGNSNHGVPAFIEDPLARLGIGAVSLREKGPRPVVGFCGQAGASLPRHAVRLVRNKLHRLNWRLGRERWEPPPMEHTWFRHRIVEGFARSPAVETKFVLRTKYRAGVTADNRNDPADRARREFLENVLGTDYTLCMRGGGNFSIRFYEALAMGRVPAFIDTDCLLPYDGQIDWRHYTVWIDQDEIRSAPRILAEDHARISPQEFRERQLECRRLWNDRLTADGFYSHFHEHFPELEG